MTYNMTRRKIRKCLVDYIVPILNRNNVTYTLHERYDKEYSLLETNLSSKEYHLLVERAMCEKESAELHNGRQVISYYECVTVYITARAFIYLRRILKDIFLK